MIRRLTTANENAVAVGTRRYREVIRFVKFVEFVAVFTDC